MSQNIFKKNPYLVQNRVIYLSDSYKEFEVSINDEKVIIKHLKSLVLSEFDRKLVVRIKFADLDLIDLSKESIIPVDDIIDVERDEICIDPADLIKNDLNFYNKKGKVQIEGKSANVISLPSNETEKACFKLEPNYKNWHKIEYKVLTETNSGVTSSAYKGHVFFRTPDMPKDSDMFRQYYLEDLQVLPAWKYYSGRGVKIGIIDDNMYWKGDLSENIKFSENGHLTTDEMMHSLAVGGVIGAQKNNHSLIGIAYNAELYFHDYITQLKNIFFTSNETLEALAMYDVINNSWGQSIAFDDEHLFTAEYRAVFSPKDFYYAIQNGRNGLGTVIVFASGNNRLYEIDSNLDTTDHTMLIVSGVMKDDNLKVKTMDYSFPSIGSNVLISAPANNLPLLGVKNCILPLGKAINCEDTILINDGTSFSAPMVTALVGLMLEANSALGWRDIHEIIALTARVAYNQEDQNNKAINWNSKDMGMHYFHDYGFGIVTVDSAVRLAESWNLQQTSKNQRVLEGQKVIFGSRLNFENFNVPWEITENIQIESVSIELLLHNFISAGTNVYLQSPSSTTSLIFRGSHCYETNMNSTSLFYKEIESVQFRGEYSYGKWLAIFQKDTSCTNRTIFKSDGVNQIALNIFGKEENTPKIHYFTDELSLLKSSELLVDTRTNGINSAASTFNLTLDLRNNATSSIGGKKITFEEGQPLSLSFITCGDGDDTITLKGSDSTIVPGRGYNQIYLYNMSKAVISFPNLNVHSGRTTIYATSIKDQVELKYGKGEICFQKEDSWRALPSFVCQMNNEASDSEQLGNFQCGLESHNITLIGCEGLFYVTLVDGLTP